MKNELVDFVKKVNEKSPVVTTQKKEVAAPKAETAVQMVKAAKAQAITEAKAEPLESHDQKSFFRGWLFAHIIEEPDYLEKITSEIRQDFTDDYSQMFDEETLEIDDDTFESLLTDMKHKIAAIDDDTDEEVPEPTDDTAEETPEENPEANPEAAPEGEEAVNPEEPTEDEAEPSDDDEEDHGEVQKI
jgi:hypothetical protein